MSKLKNICIIPARGGSKRIPNTNIVDFHGKPMLAYTIEAAIKSGLFGQEIYVSSDSEKILKIAKRYKVKTIKRPAAISGDKAGLESAVLHLLENAGANRFDNLCLMMPNCPLRSSVDVRNSYKSFLKSKASTLMSVVAYEWLYPFWALQEKNEVLKPFFSKKYFIDSKLLPKDIYCPTGAVRWVNIKKFLKHKTFYGKDLAKYVIPFERSADIDTFADLELAKKLFRINKA
jgi:CMP-N-acetylneuraminic acid synthetase